MFLNLRHCGRFRKARARLKEYHNIHLDGDNYGNKDQMASLKQIRMKIEEKKLMQIDYFNDDDIILLKRINFFFRNVYFLSRHKRKIMKNCL